MLTVLLCLASMERSISMNKEDYITLTALGILAASAGYLIMTKTGNHNLGYCTTFLLTTIIGLYYSWLKR